MLTQGPIPIQALASAVLVSFGGFVFWGSDVKVSVAIRVGMDVGRSAVIVLVGIDELGTKPQPEDVANSRHTAANENIFRFFVV